MSGKKLKNTSCKFQEVKVTSLIMSQQSQLNVKKKTDRSMTIQELIANMRSGELNANNGMQTRVE